MWPMFNSIEKMRCNYQDVQIALSTKEGDLLDMASVRNGKQEAVGDQRIVFIYIFQNTEDELTEHFQKDHLEYIYFLILILNYI